MIMKKLFLSVCLLVLVLSGCGKAEDEEFKATDILSEEEVAEFIDYKPVVEERRTRLLKSVKYKNPEIGKSDIVEVLVYPENQKMTRDDIKAQFEEQKKRNIEYDNLIDVEGIDADVFIAIPSVHIYKNGYYAVISAGSGGAEKQIDLLERIAEVAVQNIDELTENEEQK